MVTVGAVQSNHCRQTAAACAKLGRFHLEDCELYATCEPCPMCLAALYWAGFTEVYFAASAKDAAAAGFADDFITAEFAKPSQRRRLPPSMPPVPWFIPSVPPRAEWTLQPRSRSWRRRVMLVCSVKAAPRSLRRWSPPTCLMR